MIKQLVVADLAGGVDWANRLEIRHGHLVGPYGLSVSRPGIPVGAARRDVACRRPGEEVATA